MNETSIYLRSLLPPTFRKQMPQIGDRRFRQTELRHLSCRFLTGVVIRRAGELSLAGGTAVGYAWGGPDRSWAEAVEFILGKPEAPTRA
jgi:hypothetical protein